MMARAIKARKRQRGAAMVEAIVVISVFILFLLGTVYFKNLYQQKLHVLRLGRASTIAYSMAACGIPPTQPIQKDLYGSTGNASNANNPIGTDPNAPSDGKASGALGPALNNAGGGSDHALGNPVGDVKVTGKAVGVTKDGMFSPTYGFKSTVGTESWASCSDQVRDGDFDEVVGFVTSQFKR